MIGSNESPKPAHVAQDPPTEAPLDGEFISSEAGNAQDSAPVKRKGGPKPKKLRRGWKEDIARAALTATSIDSLRLAYVGNRKSTSRGYVSRNTWAKWWHDESTGLRDFAEKVWSERRNPVVEQIANQAAAGDLAAIDRFMKYVDPEARRERRESQQRGPAVNVNVGEGSQVTILAPPATPTIDDYLREKGLINDD